MTVLWILLALFLALVIIVPLLERFGPRLSDVELGKISRWILPLLAISLVAQLLVHYLGG